MRAPRRSPGRAGERTGAGAAMLRGGTAVLRRAASGGGGHGQGQGSSLAQPLEPSLLRFLVCPLSKRPLR